MKVLCIGNASYDISMPVSEYPVENSKYKVSNKVECGGGTASNAAYLLGKWGVDTYFQGMVGNDIFGDRIINEFKNVNVNTEYVKKLDNEDTPICFILVNESNGSRTLFHNTKNRRDMEFTDYSFNPDIILVDSHFYEASKNAFIKYPNAIKVIDAGRVTPELLDLCTMVDYLICSRGFAETVTKTRIDFNDLSTLKDVYEKLEGMYSARIVVTLENKGCLYKENKEIKIMGALKVNPVDTTGAGDIFHGAFVYGLTQKYPLSKILSISNIAAGLAVTKIGTRNSVFSIEEVMKIYEKFNS